MHCSNAAMNLWCPNVSHHILSMMSQWCHSFTWYLLVPGAVPWTCFVSKSWSSSGPLCPTGHRPRLYSFHQSVEANKSKHGKHTSTQSTANKTSRNYTSTQHKPNIGCWVKQCFSVTGISEGQDSKISRLWIWLYMCTYICLLRLSAAKSELHITLDSLRQIDSVQSSKYRGCQ